MISTSRITRLALLGLGALLFACADSPTGPRTATVIVHLMTPATVASVTVEISGPGLSPPVVVNIPIGADTTARDTLILSAGSARRVVITAFDSAGVRTHRADTTITLVAGMNPPLAMRLEPLHSTLSITVVFGGVRLTVSDSSRRVLAVGDTMRVVASALTPSGAAVPADSLVWAASNPAVFTVAAGLITGLRADTGTLVVSYRGAAVHVGVRVVTPVVASVTLDRSVVRLVVGSTSQLSATVKDSTGEVLGSSLVTWTSSDPTVATVSSSGLVTAVPYAGDVAVRSAVILATAQGKSSSLSIEVSKDAATFAAEVEKLIANSYNTWFGGALACCAVVLQQGAMAAEFSPMASNFGMIERSLIPRQAPNNTTSDQFSGQYYQDYSYMYRAISNASDGLKQMDAGVSLGDASANARARAWGKFVQGISHGYLAQTYDSVLVVDENTDLGTVAFVGADSGIKAALGLLDAAITIANANTFTLPSTWSSGNALSNLDLVRLARTYKARFRANAARFPSDVAAIDWAAVIADVNAGITADYNVTSDFNVWYFGPQQIHSFYGAWNQVHMFYMGVADTSGAYQTWAGTNPIENRQAFVIATPDLRWPRGTNATTQGAADGRYMRYKGTSGHVRADRGTWRFSFYQNRRYQPFYDSGFIGPHPVVLKQEMDFLLAEAYIRNGQSANALPIINASRAAAGLPDATLAGVPDAASCVPRLPNGTCGTLLEALKYEKRIETMYMNTWYFDSRRWGDLVVGTPVDYPVPARELEVLGLPLYTRGGVGLTGGSLPGTYGF